MLTSLIASLTQCVCKTPHSLLLSAIARWCWLSQLIPPVSMPVWRHSRGDEVSLCVPKLCTRKVLQTLFCFLLSTASSDCSTVRNHACKISHFSRQFQQTRTIKSKIYGHSLFDTRNSKEKFSLTSLCIIRPAFFMLLLTVLCDPRHPSSGAPYPGVSRSEPGANHSPPSRAEVKNMLNFVRF
jgi:hypothetical protein